MVQVLPYVQTPLEQLTPYIGQAAQLAGFGIGRHLENKRDAEIMKTFTGPNVTAGQMIQAYDRLSARGKANMSPIIAAYIKPVSEAEQVQKYRGGKEAGGLPEGITPVPGTGSAPSEQAQSTTPVPGLAQPPMQGQGTPEQTAPKPQMYNIQGIEGMQFSPEEVKVLTPPTRAPAVGALKGEAQIDAQTMAASKKELNKYIQPAITSISSLKSRRAGLDRVESLYKTGKASIGNAQNLLAAFSKAVKLGDSSVLESILKTTEAKAVDTIMRDQLAGVKEFGGSRPSQQEVFIQKAALPNYLDSEAAAQLKIDVLRDMTDYNLKKNELISKLSSKNPYLSPQDLENIVQSKMQPEASKLLNKMNQGGIFWQGQAYDIPPDKQQAFISTHPGAINTLENVAK